MNLPVIIENFPVIQNWGTLSKNEKQQELCRIEDDLRDKIQDDERVVCNEPPIKEFFCNGIYAREITMPRGDVIVGKIHVHETINVVSKGRALVATDEGLVMYEAPATFIGHVGVKRLLFILEDTVWTTFHKTDKTTGVEVSKECVVDTYEELNKHLEIT